jgi:iron(III) transport system substrate-binding protein
MANHFPCLIRFSYCLTLLCLAGCWTSTQQEVIVYSALDREFSAPVLEQFSTTSGLEPLAVYDVESTKTVGLFQRIRQEKSRPRCDVFWNNEILHTIFLEREGLLEPFRTAAAERVRAGYRSRTDSWTGFAARARVLLVNRDILPEAAERPLSIQDLADPRWRKKTAFARPFFGTTKTHFLVLYQHWGKSRSRQFFTELRRNAIMVDGNKQVAVAVARGQVAFGLTDTDDAIVEIEQGAPVVMVFPDQQPEAIGSLFIPNTVALIRGGPNPEQGRKLIDFLVSDATESLLAAGASAQFPVLAGSTKSRIHPQGDLHWMEVDFEAVADAAEEGMELLLDIFYESPD